jgi:hypothetical protein
MFFFYLHNGEKDVHIAVGHIKSNENDDQLTYFRTSRHRSYYGRSLETFCSENSEFESWHIISSFNKVMVNFFL